MTKPIQHRNIRAPLRLWWHIVYPAQGSAVASHLSLAEMWCLLRDGNRIGVITMERWAKRKREGVN